MIKNLVKLKKVIDYFNRFLNLIRIGFFTILVYAQFLTIFNKKFIVL